MVAGSGRDPAAGGGRLRDSRRHGRCPQSAAMGTLYLVRHGQASFGAADYDQLSPLGERQCRALGQWFAARGMRFQAALCGTLRRHVQTLDALRAGLQAQPGADAASVLPAALPWPGLNEYDSLALLRSVSPAGFEGGSGPIDAETTRAHFRLLRTALTHWVDGQCQPEGMPDWPSFRAGVVAALDHVRSAYSGNVLLVSSGGPISTAVAHVLQAPDASFIELNLRTRNSGITEFAYNPRRHTLQAFNQVPHLAGAERADWLTHS